MLHVFVRACKKERDDLMKLLVRNFAKIGAADVEVCGLTVITGSNGSGKSTIGKLFFCLINAVYKTKTDFEREKKRRIRSVLEHTDDFSIESFFKSSKKADMHKLAEKIVTSAETTDEEKELIAKYKAKIEKILNISEQDFFKVCLEKMFKYEFGSQLLNVDSMTASTLELVISETTYVKLKIYSNAQMEVSYGGFEDDSLTNAFYIDTPYIMDEANFGAYHRRELKRRIVTETDNLAQKVFDRLFMDVSESEENDSGEVVNITNEAAGYKTVLMLKRLLSRGYLSGGNILILDEPEMHLHPDLQIILAEILIMLIKENRINVLLNTHSPYFLEAVELFSLKHKIQDSCKYYLTLDKGTKSFLNDTSHDLEAIYHLLAMPFEKLEKIRNDLDDSE